MGRKFLLEDGTTADVPDESVDKWMQRMDQRGVKFKDAGFDAAADKTTAPVSKDIVMPVQRIEGDPEAGMSALQKLGKLLSSREETPAPGEFRGPDEGLQGVKDTLTVGSGGVTAKLDQRLPFVGQDIKAARDEAAGRLGPAGATLADLTGALISPVGLEGKAGGWLGAVGRAAATGGLQGASRSIGDANPDEDTATQAMRALAAGGKGVAYGTGAGLLGEGVGALAKPLDRASVALRRSAFPGTAGDHQSLIDEMGTRKGLEFIENDLGRLPEKQGLTNVIIPQSASGLAKRAAAKNADVNGPAIGDSLSEAGYQLTPQPQRGANGVVDRGVIDSRLAEQVEIAKKAPQLTGQDASNFLEVRGRLDNQTVNTPMDLQRLKNRYEEGAYAPGAIAGSMESSAAKVNAEAARATREHLNDVMSQADPATYSKFKRANENYGELKMVERLAGSQAARGYAAPLLSAGLGGVAGYEVRHKGGDALAGAALGGSLGRTYGADLAANVTRLGERGASAVADAEPALAKLGGLLASKESSASAQDAAGEARGHLIPEAIQDALKQNKLGPYSDELARAAMSPEPGALGVAYSRLSRDPGFAEYKRMLQEMTGSM